MNTSSSSDNYIDSTNCNTCNISIDSKSREGKYGHCLPCIRIIKRKDRDNRLKEELLKIKEKQLKVNTIRYLKQLEGKAFASLLDYEREKWITNSKELIITGI